MRPSTFIDVFAGCGGLSLGLMLAGWRGVLAVEKDPFAFETLRCNLTEGNKQVGYAWPAWFPQAPCDVGTFVRSYRKQIAGLRGRVDLIVGGPPCQGFSLAGRRNRNDVRSRMFKHYFEIIEMVRPPLILLENVRGITIEFGKKRRLAARRNGRRPTRPFSERVRATLECMDYVVHPGLVRAVDFGVPQFRPRYIMFGIDRGFLRSRTVRG